MITLSLAEIAEIVAGELADADPSLQVTGPAFLDSRAPEPGGLFVAFAGERADGHEYAPSAVAGGAAAVLGSRPTGVPTVVVPDARAALQALATHVLERLRARPGALSVIAITGSQGKTSAKDMLARVLAGHGRTVATAGSFNNELGMPLTVLRADPDTRHLILEMGARGVGHLAELCAIARPDVSIVLNVGKAHLGEFGSQEQIAVAKGELVEALDPDGVAVLNLDDPLVAAMTARTRGRVLTFGTAEAADVRLSGLRVDDLGRPSFALTHADRTEQVDLRLLGEHQAFNAAAALAAALAVGMDLEAACRGLREIESLSRWRMELHERSDGLVVVNDAYNANPDSMRSALQTLARMGSAGRRTLAVLGQMRELGDAADAEHAALGALTAELGIDIVLVVADGADAAYDARIAARGDDGSTRRAEGVDEAAAWLRENVGGPDVVLVKASRSVGLERVAEILLAHEPGEEPVR